MKNPCLVLWLMSGLLLAETAPENLPRLTVRWEDPEQRDIFVVEGEKYECRVGTVAIHIGNGFGPVGEKGGLLHGRLSMIVD